MTMKNNTYCVIDIGGTNFRAGIYSCQKLEVDSMQNLRTPNHAQFNNEYSIKEKIVEMILDCYNRISQQHLINQLAICFPGPVTSDGIILGSSVIFGKQLQKEFFLYNELKSKTPDELKITITNDITASAWRYNDKYNSFCLITVSSGIGNKICYNGNVLVGNNGISGEIGHYSYDTLDLSIPCSCGWGKNHLGMISSGRGIENVARLFASPDGKFRSLFLSSELAMRVNNNEKKITAELIARYADKNDTFPCTIVDYCTTPLSDVICLLALSMFIEKFILIGGFALNCRYYLESLKYNVLRRGIYNFQKKDIDTMIIYGENDDNHALIGLGKMLDKKLIT